MNKQWSITNQEIVRALYASTNFLVLLEQEYEKPDGKKAMRDQITINQAALKKALS